MTLKEILHGRYDELKKYEPITSDFETFYNNESRKLTDIFKLLQLDEWAEKLKSNGEYHFSQERADFVSNLFKEYSGKGSKLDAIRRGNFSKFNSKFVEYLYNGFMEMFREAGASPEDLSQIDLCLQKSLFADFYIARARYNRTKAKLEKFFKERVTDDPLDCIELLKHFAFEFEKLSEPFIERMEGLAEAMSEIRWEGLADGDRLNKEIAKISPEETIRNELLFMYSDKIKNALANDEELKNLKQEHESLQNQYAKKPPLLNKKKQVKELETKISERETEIETRTIEEEHTKTLQGKGSLKNNERFTLPEIKNPYISSPENMMSSHDVLLLALERLQEDDENFENDKDAPK